MVKMEEFNGLTFREKGMFHVFREKDTGGNVSIIPFLHMKARLLCSEDGIRTFASVLVYFPLTHFAQTCFFWTGIPNKNSNNSSNLNIQEFCTIDAGYSVNCERKWVFADPYFPI